MARNPRVARPISEYLGCRWFILFFALILFSFDEPCAIGGGLDPLWPFLFIFSSGFFIFYFLFVFFCPIPF
ncbi:hypothetical protein B9Z19DRAFT_1072872 [Tuber borchii]|uniref:Uncharacterized protein n=1 Tax=Tuber borchii TaxID=42251 RepID=A0A2T7A6P1_TUBBO|nr:hypothetical protein B9Z19DRAFT_1072872 [Tuber borchii]